MKPQYWLSLISIAVLTGCATSKRPALPANQISLGYIPGLEHVRFWGDQMQVNPEAAPRMRQQILAHNPAELEEPQSFLVISGGGQNGAFGAGLLNGWSAHGDRPEFRLVTGISTGAIIAPFAFLGQKYDNDVKEIYTLYSTEEVLKKTIFSALFGGESLTDSERLLNILKKYINAKTISEIAAEHRNGRRLLVGTTNLDAKRPVIWDLGAIADSGHPDTAELIPRIILASASIPGAFPPILFDVQKNGTLYNELHVDGGIANQLFISPISFSIRDAMNRVGFKADGTIYVIRNSAIRSKWELVKPSAIAVSAASISGLTLNQGNSDQHVVYLKSIQDKLGFRAAHIPESFQVEPDEVFDVEYMQRLFSVAFDLAEQGFPWVTSPNLPTEPQP